MRVGVGDCVLEEDLEPRVVFSGPRDRRYGIKRLVVLEPISSHSPFH